MKAFVIIYTNNKAIRLQTFSVWAMNKKQAVRILRDAREDDESIAEVYVVTELPELPIQDSSLSD